MHSLTTYRYPLESSAKKNILFAKWDDIFPKKQGLENSLGKQPVSSPSTKRFILARICKDPQETKIQWRDRKLCWSCPSLTSSLYAADVVCVSFGALISNLSLLPCTPPSSLLQQLSSRLSNSPLVFLPSKFTGWSEKGEVPRCQRPPGKKNNLWASPSRSLDTVWLQSANFQL